MAEFCHQCSINIFGFDGGDHVSNEERRKVNIPEGMGWNAICEGCGFTIVDHVGQCISSNCLHSTAPSHKPTREYLIWDADAEKFVKDQEHLYNLVNT